MAANAEFMREFGSFIDLNLTLQAPDDTVRYFALPHVLSAVDDLEARLATHPRRQPHLLLHHQPGRAAPSGRRGGEPAGPLTAADRPLIELAARMSTLAAAARSRSRPRRRRDDPDQPPCG